MKRLAIIGASYLQLPLILRAKELGYETHVFAWKADDVGEYAADCFYPISIVNKDEILAQCREIGICGVCSIASDLAAITVNYIANAMGLPGNSMEATAKSTNKHLMRMAFAENGDPSPKSALFREGDEIDASAFQYPLIVKPTDRSGSRGITKLETPDGLSEAVRNALKESMEKKILIEEFAEGDEYSVEYISYRRKHHFLTVTEKHTTGAPHFIETGHREPAPLSDDMVSRIRKIVEHALDSLGITDSASHTELKISHDGQIRIIEIGGRMGGDCIGSDLVQLSTGIDYVRAVIQVATGQVPNLTPVGPSGDVECVYLLNSDDVRKLEHLKATLPQKLIREVYFKPELLSKTTDSSTRAGCYLRWV